MTRRRLTLGIAGAALTALATLSGCGGGRDPLMAGDTPCAQAATGKITCIFPLDGGTRNHVIRTAAEYDAVFAEPCAFPNDYPPRPAAGEVLFVAAREWTGCGGCARITCVEKTAGQPFVVSVEVLQGHGDCDAEGTTGAWALAADNGQGATFVDVGLPEPPAGTPVCP